MIKDLNLLHSDLILGSARILVLLSKFHKVKSYKMNLDKIMALDFYMKFPAKMIENKNNKNETLNFDDVYSYFHWKPDRDQYNLFLNYLISKKLVRKEIIKKDFIYVISEDGMSVVSQFQSKYYLELDKTALYIKSHISKLSDEKLDSMILEKTLNNFN